MDQLRRQQQQCLSLGLLFWVSFVSKHQLVVFEVLAAVARNTTTLQASPGARELLLSPCLLCCLAIMVLQTVLVLCISICACDRAAATPATSSSSGKGSSSSTACQSVGSGGRQLPEPAAGSASGPGNTMWLGSLTPLSCGLFGVLCITQETAVMLARSMKPDDNPYRLCECWWPTTVFLINR
jgi:hypothetical protein